jgi:DNA repair exonuclease SbcCD ATPase subunit
LKKLVTGSVKVAQFNGNSRNAQLNKFVSLVMESFDSITAIGGRVGKYDITSNPLKSSIESLSSDLTTLISNMGNALRDADSKLIPAGKPDEEIDIETPTPESLAESKPELQSLFDAHQEEMRKLEDEKSSISAERQQLTKDRSQFLKEKEAYKQELKSLKKEKKTFEDDQKEFATTKANWVDNLNQDDSSNSSHSSDSSSTSSRRTTRSSSRKIANHINSLPQSPSLTVDKI